MRGLVFALRPGEEGLTGALLVIALSRYAGALAYLTLLARADAPTLRPDVSLARTMLRYGLRIYVAALVSLLVIRLDLLLVNAFLGSDEAGLYSVAAALADGMFVLPMVIGLNLLTRVARGDPDQATAEIFRSVFVLYGLVCLATVPVAGFGIRVIFGEGYADAESPLLLAAARDLLPRDAHDPLAPLRRPRVSARGHGDLVRGASPSISRSTSRSCPAAVRGSRRSPRASRTRCCSRSTCGSSRATRAGSASCDPAPARSSVSSASR